MNFYVYAQGFSVATWNFMYIVDLRIIWLKKFLFRLTAVLRFPNKNAKRNNNMIRYIIQKNMPCIHCWGDEKRRQVLQKWNVSWPHSFELSGKKMKWIGISTYLATLFHICWGQLNKFPIVICSRKINSYFQPQNKNFCKPPSAINGLFETSKM